MRRRRQWMWFFGIVGGFVVLLGILYARMVQVRQRALSQEVEERVRLVRVQPIRPTEAWRTVTFLARVEGAQEIRVRARVGGRVVDHLVVRGQRVRKGEPLLRLEDERKVLILREAEARWRAARATLADLERRCEQARDLVNAGVISRDTLASLERQLEAQRARVQALEAAYERARWDVDHLTVRSPIDGTVVAIVPDIGQEVLANEVVATVINLKQRRVVAGLDATWARRVRPGMGVELLAVEDGRLKRVGHARIVGVSPNADPVTGTYTVEARIMGKTHDWWGGEVVYIRVPIERLHNVVRVPRTAFVSDDTGVYLFVYKDGKALQVPVTVTWISEDEGAVPVKLLPKRASIIVEGLAGLADGQPVRVARSGS